MKGWLHIRWKDETKGMFYYGMTLSSTSAYRDFDVLIFFSTRATAFPVTPFVLARLINSGSIILHGRFPTIIFI